MSFTGGRRGNDAGMTEIEREPQDADDREVELVEPEQPDPPLDDVPEPDPPHSAEQT